MTRIGRSSVEKANTGESPTCLYSTGLPSRLAVSRRTVLTRASRILQPDGIDNTSFGTPTCDQRFAAGQHGSRDVPGGTGRIVGQGSESSAETSASGGLWARAQSDLAPVKH
ncbi:hypothetical protein M8818_003854 [Zalaria obscura]|uniref:Uncharacterized protein n=1 Tax=Zalaria obscura TaxID=2024903 RepID=A0ACC3SDK9_9PEZI